MGKSVYTKTTQENNNLIDNPTYIITCLKSSCWGYFFHHSQYCLRSFRVLKNISNTVLALVEKEGEFIYSKIKKSTYISNICVYCGDFLLGAHHVDLRFSTKEDPQWLRDVRRREVEIIGKWISEYFQDLAQ